MTTTRQQQPTSRHPIPEKNTTQQPDTDTDEQPRTDTTKSKTKRSHHCITIRGAVPASGRPAATDPLVDLVGAGLRAGAGWSSC